MALVRFIRPTFLGDTALSLLFGAIGGLVVAVVVALTGYPEWGETLFSMFVVLSGSFVVGLAIRLLLHGMYSYVDRGLDPSPEDGPMSRSRLLASSLPWLRVGAGAAGAAAVLSLALLLGTGDAWPD